MRHHRITVLLVSLLATEVVAEQWTSSSGQTINAKFVSLDEAGETLTILAPTDIPLSKLHPFSVGRAQHLSAKAESDPSSHTKPPKMESWISSDGRFLNAPFLKLNEEEESVTVLTPKVIPFSLLAPASLERARHLESFKPAVVQKPVALKTAKPQRSVSNSEPKGGSLFSSLFGSPKDPAYSVISKALKKGNRAATRLSKVERRGDIITITFAVNDNLLDSMIIGGAKVDIRDCLKAVSRSGLDYSEIRFQGTFALVDKYGNSTEGKVLDMTYTKRDVERINWNDFLFGDAFAVASDSWLHPAFQ